ncbi:hypothetical protein [Candidatus Synechococcus spongiarum]|uniref:Type IV pilus biogenesis protein PilO n=1 Tax=Candidatus Synechococcus spongiarum TaxID=431041 RepID=A0A170T8L7_9SYNE|nr:hypothetical protein [Candidatus Synechococcus spongiarum]CZB17456.1 hypothetical protein FLM9_806 [Candidatus Synechococcus spongiarum]
MTNFSDPSPAKRQLTQEQVLLAFPLAVAALAAMTLLLVWVWPQWQQRQALIQRRDAVLQQQQQLGQQRHALAEARQQVQQAVNHQAQILALIAPTRQLDTLLTTVAEAAQARQVQLVRYEPRQSVGGTPSTPAAATGEDTPANSDAEQEPTASPGDPLLAPGLQKQEILLTFEGDYGNILAVLQSLESLQPLVVAHDLKLEGRPPSADQPPSTQAATTRMNLRLTVYAQAQDT